MIDLLIRAFAAGAGVALIAGPLGCFVVWRRMAYFGDTMAHAALLGVAVGLVLGLSPLTGVLAIGVLVALALVAMSGRRDYASDTVLGILAHGSLAVGLVVLSFLEFVRVDLMAWLFGDVLAVGWGDVALIWLGAVVGLGVLTWMWRPLLAVTVDEDLARVEGLPVTVLGLALMVLIAITVAAAMKVVGALMVTSLLVIPAAAARRFAASPEQMAVGAALAGMAAVGLGLSGAFLADTPAGPSIVVAALALFLLSLLGGGVRRLAARR